MIKVAFLSLYVTYKKLPSGKGLRPVHKRQTLLVNVARTTQLSGLAIVINVFAIDSYYSWLNGEELSSSFPLNEERWNYSMEKKNRQNQKKIKNDKKRKNIVSKNIRTNTANVIITIASVPKW